MHSNGAQVLSAMLAQLTGVHIAADKLSKNLGAVRTAAISAGAVFAGWKVLDGIWHAIEGSRELNKELEKTKQLGGDFAANIGNTRDAAIRTTGDVPTSTLSENVRMARELGVTIGKPEAAAEMLSEASKAAYVISHFTGEGQEDIVKNLTRTADARAQIYKVGPDGKEHVDPERLTAELNAAAKGLILGGGFIKSSDLLQMARQGGAAVKSQPPEAFYATGVEAGIALGASKTGTAETGLMQQFVGGTMTKRVAEHLTQAGLLKQDEWHSGKGGGVVIDPGVAKRFTELMKDPVAWLSTGEGGAAIKQYAAKNGIDQMMAIFQLFGRQTVQRLVSEITSNKPQFDRAREIYGNIPSVDAQYKELQGHDLDTNIKSVTAAWKSFTEAFSDAATPLVIPILHGLTDAIHLLVVGAAEYPHLTAGLIGLTAGLAGLTALGGALALLNLCWAPLATGLTLLTGVPALAGTGAAISALGVGIASLAGVFATPAVIAMLAKLGSDAETPENRAKIEQNRAARGSGLMPETNDGFGPDGRPVSTYVAPPSSGQKVELKGDINMDGKKVGTIVANGIADRMSRPSTGTNGPDLRVSPWMPGLAAGAH